MLTSPEPDRCFFAADDRDEDCLSAPTADAFIEQPGNPSGAGRLPATVILSWNPHQPFELIMLVRDRRHVDAVKWQFARELLILGGGIGDVVVRRGAVDTLITVRSPEGAVAVRLPAAFVRGFTDRIEHAIPLGSEPSLCSVSDVVWQRELAFFFDGTWE